MAYFTTLGIARINTSKPFSTAVGQVRWNVYDGSPVLYRHQQIDSFGLVAYPIDAERILQTIIGTLDKSGEIIPLTSAYQNGTFEFQLRPFSEDVENQAIHGTRTITVADYQHQVALRGHGRTTKIVIGAATATIEFVWDQAADGQEPSLFRLTDVGGGGIPEQTLAYSPNVRVNRFTVAGLLDGVAYTFRIAAERDTASVLLTGTDGNDIKLTGDAAGPPAPTGLAGRPY